MPPGNSSEQLRALETLTRDFSNSDSPAIKSAGKRMAAMLSEERTMERLLDKTAQYFKLRERVFYRKLGAVERLSSSGLSGEKRTAGFNLLQRAVLDDERLLKIVSEHISGLIGFAAASIEDISASNVSSSVMQSFLNILTQLNDELGYKIADIQRQKIFCENGPLFSDKQQKSDLERMGQELSQEKQRLLRFSNEIYSIYAPLQKQYADLKFLIQQGKKEYEKENANEQARFLRRSGAVVAGVGAAAVLGGYGIAFGATVLGLIMVTKIAGSLLFDRM